MHLVLEGGIRKWPFLVGIGAQLEHTRRRRRLPDRLERAFVERSHGDTVLRRVPVGMLGLDELDGAIAC